MRTSRIARDTAKLISRNSPRKTSSQSQVPSFAATLQTFAAIENLGQATEAFKSNPSSDDESSLSSISSAAILDIEDATFPTSAPRKRKRDPVKISHDLSGVATKPKVRAPSRNFNLDVENDSVRKKARRQPAKEIVNEAGEVEIHPPVNWEKVYDAMKDMRKSVTAPVDTMGCETLAQERISPRDKRFQTLIALMLSSQTKDTTNAIAMRRLQNELPAPGLTLENILDVDPVRLNELIYVVGFHNNKTRYIKATAIILRDSFASDIPDTIEGLMSLPGVGPKMAYLCLSAAWGRTEGIGVDVHVHRITNLWGWHKTKTPEETRLTLQAWLPREKWHEINHLLVGFGQTICLPVGRDCQTCTLSAKGLCPSAVISRSKTTKKLKKKENLQRTGQQAGDAKSEQVLAVKEELIEENENKAGFVESKQVLVVNEEAISVVKD